MSIENNLIEETLENLVIASFFVILNQNGFRITEVVNLA